MSRAWAEIDLGAASRNVAALRLATGRPLIAVVKANAYGHGAVQVGRAALEAGACLLAVATVDEAVELRESLGCSAPLLVLGALLDEEALQAVSSGIVTVIHERACLERIARAARSLGTVARVHVEVDSGLARHGASPREAIELALEARRTSGVALEGLMTHMARAVSREATLEQLARFRPVAAALRERGSPLLVHAAASNAALLHEEARLDAIRPGIALHGIDPDGSARRVGVDLSPVLSLRAKVVRVREVEAGTPVGYGATWTAPRPSRLAVVALGYDDGLPYRLTNQGSLILHGKRCPIRGTVMMDYVTCDVTDAPPVHAGSVATAIGEDSGERITVEEVAKLAGVIPYAVVCGLGRRTERVVVGKASGVAAPILTASARVRRSLSG